jgi:hypothetical protein
MTTGAGGIRAGAERSGGSGDRFDADVDVVVVVAAGVVLPDDLDAGVLAWMMVWAPPRRALARAVAGGCPAARKAAWAIVSP